MLNRRQFGIGLAAAGAVAALPRIASAKASELQRMIDNAQATALRSSDDVLKANQAASDLQQATREAEARAARLEEDLRVERLQVLDLEKKLASWAGLVGAALRKASGFPAKARSAGSLPRPT